MNRRHFNIAIGATLITSLNLDALEIKQKTLVNCFTPKILNNNELCTVSDSYYWTEKLVYVPLFNSKRSLKEEIDDLVCAFAIDCKRNDIAVFTNTGCMKLINEKAAINLVENSDTLFIKHKNLIGLAICKRDFKGE